MLYEEMKSNARNQHSNKLFVKTLPIANRIPECSIPQCVHDNQKTACMESIKVRERLIINNSLF